MADPILTKLYGGLPESGDYGCTTEYEVGAARVAEAAHCILGSLQRSLTADGRIIPLKLYYEIEHLKEEIGIILMCTEEYSKSLYHRRLLDGYYSKEKAEKSVRAIIENSKYLKNLSRKLRADLQLQGLPKEIAEKTYILIIDLANAMSKSVEDFPIHLKNAFTSTMYRAAVYQLRESLEQLYLLASL